MISQACKESALLSELKFGHVSYQATVENGVSSWWTVLLRPADCVAADIVENFNNFREYVTALNCYTAVKK